MICWYPDADVAQDALGGRWERYGHAQVWVPGVTAQDGLGIISRDSLWLLAAGPVMAAAVILWAVMVPHAYRLGELAGHWSWMVLP